jgi:hypothetical protein
MVRQAPPTNRRAQGTLSVLTVLGLLLLAIGENYPMPDPTTPVTIVHPTRRVRPAPKERLISLKDVHLIVRIDRRRSTPFCRSYHEPCPSLKARIEELAALARTWVVGLPQHRGGSWPRGRRTCSVPGNPREAVETIGPSQALPTWRPFLHYNELGFLME